MSRVSQFESGWPVGDSVMMIFPDGFIRTRDGRSLEEYINDPQLIKKRLKWMKENPDKSRDMYITHRSIIEAAAIPHCA